MFFVFPAFVFLLSLAGFFVIYIVFIPVALLLIFVTIVNVLQTKKPKFLPSKLQSWEFLPEVLRSLEPEDRLVVAAIGWWRRTRQGNLNRNRQEVLAEDGKKLHEVMQINMGFQDDTTKLHQNVIP